VCGSQLENIVTPEWSGHYRGNGASSIDLQIGGMSFPFLVEGGERARKAC
jgi:hypothetical protein